MNCAELHNNLEKTTEDGCAIDIENGTFHWSAECPPVLNNINIKVLKGSFTIVLGPVGSGKTSLLAAILGDLYTAQGTIKQVGKVAYVPQQAWIYNSSFKNNITFGNPAMNLYYGKAINACALSSDILQLPYGDKTMMGEKGINLSGGQKQRISLARAACSKSDIYLLDDPLSALDTNVGEHIFDNLIGPKGILKNCTRILVTHGTKFLKYADNIIVLKNGCITKQGRFVDPMDKCGETVKLFTHQKYANSSSLGKDTNHKAQKISFFLNDHDLNTSTNYE
jgi:ABC-type bacteriocin/lantibiotic exporter with double-glycine peptidase domain